ncbi:hypothetical protein AA309_10210 [Microvirga vignae]|uniref:Uncharacterized protein n=1 Tax=Microvirga vignae TaxID=1225564 RepID=A0A0H1RDC4_9HYPH|nr:hypothetical protein AA309_10210 [Microvirga vignae]
MSIEIAPVGQSSSPVELDLDQLSTLIRLLGQTRCHMVNGRPVPPLEGRTIETVYAPRWYIQVAKIDGSLLAFDHPAFGAVGFVISRAEVAEIVQVLSEHLKLPPDRPSVRN